MKVRVTFTISDDIRQGIAGPYSDHKLATRQEVIEHIVAVVMTSFDDFDEDEPIVYEGEV